MIICLLTQRPDFPFAPGSSIMAGLGLWHSVAGTIIIKGTIYIVGVILYFSATIAKDKTGVFAFWSLILVLAFAYIGNIFGPPPPDTKTFTYLSPIGYLIVLWGYWIERHRELKKIR